MKKFTKSSYASQEIPKIKSISCGDEHSLLLDENNKLWMSGKILGKKMLEFTQIVTDNIPEIVSIRSGTGFCLLVDINGNLWTCGANDYRTPLIYVPLFNNLDLVILNIETHLKLFPIWKILLYTQ